MPKICRQCEADTSKPIPQMNMFHHLLPGGVTEHTLPPLIPTVPRGIPVMLNSLGVQGLITTLFGLWKLVSVAIGIHNGKKTHMFVRK